MEPTILYRCPGEHRGPSARTYNWRAARTPAELDLLLKEGWSKSLPEAVAAEKVALASVQGAAKALASAALLPPLPPLPDIPPGDPTPPGKPLLLGKPGKK